MNIRAYLAVLAAFLVIDGLWISGFLFAFYQQEIGGLLAAEPNMAAASVFYLAYAGGIVLLAVQPALRGQAWAIAAQNGAVLGALAYGTYTVTNYAVLEGWTLALVFSDIAWGAFLTALCAVCGYAAGRRG